MAEESSAALKNCPLQSCIAALLFYTLKVRLYFLHQDPFNSLNLRVEKRSAAMKNCPLQICIAALLFSTLKVITPPSH